MDLPVFAYLALGLQACTVIPFSKMFLEIQMQILILARGELYQRNSRSSPLLHFYDDLIAKA